MDAFAWLCVCVDVFVSAAGHPYTDYPSHLECGDR